jgi:hypothetical protein
MFLLLRVREICVVARLDRDNRDRGKQEARDIYFEVVEIEIERKTRRPHIKVALSALRN